MATYKTIQDVQNVFEGLNTTFQTKVDSGTLTPETIRTAWEQMLETPISDTEAECFAAYYREDTKMKGSRRKTQRRTRRRRGGALTGAPLTYGTAPGANVAVYGRFPTEVMTDPASIKNLDVFYNSGLSRGCGTENTTLTVPKDMGQNTVGGGRRRGSRKGTRKGKGKTQRRRGSRRHGGGLMDMFDTTAMRPYISTAYPNPVQSAHQMWSGQTRPVPYPSTPVYHTWKYASYQPEGINPNKITAIADDFSQLAYSK